ALPVLMRRLIQGANAFPPGGNRPIRRPRTELVREDGVCKTVRLARARPNSARILIVFDGGDGCSRDGAPRIEAWGRAEATTLPCYVVMPNREYEAWFLATIESLRGTRSIQHDATSHPDSESPRGAAEELRRRMMPNRSYSKTADQPALTAVFD